MIIKTNADPMNKKAIYRLTRASTIRVQDIEKGTSFPIDDYIIYEEDKIQKKGGVEETVTQKVLTFVSGNVRVGTVSPTFIEEFEYIVDLMDGEPFTIIITGGTSKGGRQFVSCELDCSSDRTEP